jgi:uncharacterized protein YjiS (DUF1127 family)
MSLLHSTFVDTGHDTCHRTGHRIAAPSLRLALLAPLIIWHHRHRTRRQLAVLDSRQLADVGIDPPARRAEIAKWFWQP